MPVASDHREIAAIELDDASKKRCLKWAEEVFRLFEDWTNELLAYAAVRRWRSRTADGLRRRHAELTEPRLRAAMLPWFVRSHSEPMLRRARSGR